MSWKRGGATMITDDEVMSIEEQRSMALCEAAMDTHPDWARTSLYGGGWLCEVGGLEDTRALIEWFRRSFPMEAKAIEDAITEPRTAASVGLFLQEARAARSPYARRDEQTGYGKKPAIPVGDFLLDEDDFP